jgi:hypothetical protein
MAINKNFVVKNGIEVSENLIYGDDNERRVGINSSIPDYTLDVNGDIGVTGAVAAGGTTGQANQYLKSTGTGIEWGSFPVLRDTETYIAGVGQSIFPSSGLFPHTSDFIDVFVDGVKLANSEFVSIDGNTKIQIVIPCFGNETVELIAYNTVSAGSGNTGISGISIFEDGVLTGNAGLVNTLNFVGASVTAIGSGAGVTVYITDTGGGGGTGESFWSSNGSGINTSSNVGIKTTLPRFPLEINSVGSSGTSLWVNGDARITGILTIGTASISLDGSTNTIRVGSGVTINSSSITVTDLIVTNSITGSGITVSNVTISDTAPLSPNPGNLWYSSLIGRGFIYYNDGDSSQWVDFSPSGAGATATTSSAVSSQWVTTSAGIHTLSNVGIGTTNPTSSLTVKGNTSLETLNVSGVSTFQGNLQLGDSDVINLGFGTTGDGTSDGDLQLFHNGSASYIRNNNGNLYIQSPSAIDIVDSTFSLIARFIENDAVYLFYNKSKKFETLGAGVTVTGTTFTNNLSVSGVSTLGVVTAGNIYSTGIVTATSFSGSNTLKERSIATGVTTSIANNGIGNTNITGFKSYALMKVGLSTAGWLRLYTDSTSRSNDASRSVGIDPAPGSGVIAEVVTTGISTTQIISPFVMGGNLDNPADTTIYAAITNLSGSTQAITANLTILQLEA